VLAAAAGVVVVDDDSVGESLAWLSAVAPALAFARPRRTQERFLLLTGASVPALDALVGLFGVTDGAGVGPGPSSASPDRCARYRFRTSFTLSAYPSL